MDNHEKIRIIQQIVSPWYKFEMDDFYGDRGGIPYPDIENLTKLFFKKNGRDRTLVMTKGFNCSLMFSQLLTHLGILYYFTFKRHKE